MNKQEILTKIKSRKERMEIELENIKKYTPPENHEVERISTQTYINALIFCINTIEGK